MTITKLNSFINTITWSRLFITFEALEPIELPVYPGSTFRGCLGNAFRQLVCRFPGRNCDICALNSSCLFSYMFAMPLPAQHPAFGRYTTPPRPYIISPLNNNTSVKKGDMFGFELTLIGDAVKKLMPVLPDVFIRMGQSGIGKNRGRFKPLPIMQENSAGVFEPWTDVENVSILKLTANESVYGVGQSLKLQFLTPLRLMSSGKPYTDPPPFIILAENLLRRITLIANVYCGAEWADIQNAAKDALSVTLESHQLEWVNWKRYSGTKNMHMKFDGHTGFVEYYGEIGKWLSLIKAGEILHAGSTATFGLGKYTIVQNE